MIAGETSAPPAHDPARAARVGDLGTETVFAVAAEAAALTAQGRKVYPFHLGDLNLATPANIAEATVRAMHDGKTTYCPNAGIPQLREAIAADVSDSHGLRYGPDNVSVQTGGKPVIGKFLLTMMDPGDEVLYPNPGFPIYSSLIEFFGGRAVPYTYVEGPDGFSLDLEQIERLVTPATKLLILNDLHNPTGAECTPRELEGLAELVRRHRLFVLCDEAYFDVRYEGSSHSFASLPGMDERCVILYTFSKKYAMTGWRLGAAIGPRWFIDVCNTLNVNGESCTNQFVQWGGLEALTGDQSGAREILEVLRATPRRRLRDPERHRRGALPAAQHDLLPLSERHRRDGAHRSHRLRGFPARHPPAHRRVDVHAPALRAGAGRRDPALPALRLLRPAHRRHPGRSRTAQELHRAARVTAAGRYANNDRTRVPTITDP